MKSIYSVNKLNFSYKTRKVLEDVSFTIKEGSIVGLLGPNGAGKSTLVNLLTGVLINYEGDIYFNESPIKENEIIVKSNVSAILDRSATYDNLSVEQNILYYSKLLNIPEDIGNELLEEFELTIYKKHKVRQLSSGFKQRLKIVIALLNKPSVIFLDEPWLALDPVNSRFLSGKITQLNKEQGITFLIAAHDLNELDDLCTYFLFIKSGQLILNFPRNEQSSNFDVAFVKNLEVDRSRFSHLKYFSDNTTNQCGLINPTAAELDGLDLIERKNTTLKELYFKIFT